MDKTDNGQIMSLLTDKTGGNDNFTHTTAANIDDLKKIFNVTLDPALDKQWFVNQSANNYFDIWGQKFIITTCGYKGSDYMAVTADDIKKSLRIDVTDDDAMINQYIDTAKAYVEGAVDSTADLTQYKQYDFAVLLLAQFWYQYDCCQLWQCSRGKFNYMKNNALEEFNKRYL